MNQKNEPLARFFSFALFKCIYPHKTKGYQPLKRIIYSMFL